jgi:hypothetical protein
MTAPGHMLYDPRAVPTVRRWTVRAVSMIAAGLATRSPAQIKTVLLRLRRGTRPATLEQVAQTRREVDQAVLACSGRKNCLRRSLTITLTCRLAGTWPTWVVGVRTLPPFAAHSWVEADGQPVGEDTPPGYHRALISVPPAQPQ